MRVNIAEGKIFVDKKEFHVKGINLHFGQLIQTHIMEQKKLSEKESINIAKHIIEMGFNTVRLWFMKRDGSLELPIADDALKIFSKNKIMMILNIPNHWALRCKKKHVIELIQQYDKYTNILCWCIANEIYNSKGLTDYSSISKFERITKSLTRRPTLYANHMVLGLKKPAVESDLIGYNLYSPFQALTWRGLVNQYWSNIRTKWKILFALFYLIYNLLVRVIPPNTPIIFYLRPLIEKYYRLAKSLKKPLIITEYGYTHSIPALKKYLGTISKYTSHYVLALYHEHLKNHKMAEFFKRVNARHL